MTKKKQQQAEIVSNSGTTKTSSSIFWCEEDQPTTTERAKEEEPFSKPTVCLYSCWPRRVRFDSCWCLCRFCDHRSQAAVNNAHTRRELSPSQSCCQSLLLEEEGKSPWVVLVTWVQAVFFIRGESSGSSAASVVVWRWIVGGLAEGFGRVGCVEAGCVICCCTTRKQILLLVQTTKPSLHLARK